MSYYTETLHEERHIVFYQRDVPDGMRTPWTVLVDASRCRVNEFADLTTSELLLVTLQERTRPCDKIVHMCCMSQAATQTSHPHSMQYLHNGSHLLILPVLIRALRSRTSTVISLIGQSDNYSQCFATL